MILLKWFSIKIANKFLAPLPGIRHLMSQIREEFWKVKNVTKSHGFLQITPWKVCAGWNFIQKIFRGWYEEISCFLWFLFLWFKSHRWFSITPWLLFLVGGQPKQFPERNAKPPVTLSNVIWIIFLWYFLEVLFCAVFELCYVTCLWFFLTVSFVWMCSVCFVFAMVYFLCCLFHFCL